MGDLTSATGATSSTLDRRRALRVPIRGVAVLHVGEGPLHAALENLSQSGALVSVSGRPTGPEATPPAERRSSAVLETLDIELRFADGGGGWVTGRTVRVEPALKRWRIAVAFERVDASLAASIDTSISTALGAARRRPILVIDENVVRRRELIARLGDRGMTPLAPKTPLEAVDLLASAHLHVGVCLLAPGFGVDSTDLRAVFAENFPWVEVADISDDLDATIARAFAAWSTTPVARMAPIAAG